MTENTRGALFQVALLLVAAVAGSAAFAIVPASASPTGIDSCTTITEPGTYALTQDLPYEEDRSACIQIESSDVVLNGQGHDVEAASMGGGDAVHVEGDSTLTNVTVRNLSSSTDGGFEFVGVNGVLVTGNDVDAKYWGLILTDARNVRIEGNSVSYLNSGYDALELIDSTGNTVVDNEFRSSVRLVDSDDNVFRNNDVFAESGAGVQLENSQNNEFRNGNVTAPRGFVLGETSSSNTLADNRLGSPVILHYEMIVSSPNNTITGNTVMEDTPVEVGIWLRDAAANNLISDNVFSGDSDLAGAVKLDVSAGNTWNVTPREGENVLGGSTVAGNYYADQRCLDADDDGVCDTPREHGANNVDQHPLASEDAYDVTVDVVPESQETSIGGNVTYDVVVEHVDEDIGSIDASFEIADNRSDAEVVSVADVALSHVENEETASTSDRGFKAGILDTPNEESVTVATITLHGEYAGHGTLSLTVDAIGNEKGESLNVRQPDPAQFEVEGPKTYPPINGFESGPTDPDGDGEYEDINGDGDATIVDVTALFQNLDDETIRNHPEKFDFNDDGDVDVVDVTRLFTEI